MFVGHIDGNDPIDIPWLQAVGFLAVFGVATRFRGFGMTGRKRQLEPARNGWYSPFEDWSRGICRFLAGWYSLVASGGSQGLAAGLRRFSAVVRFT